MTRLESVIEKLRALPQDEQEALAHEIESMLEHGPSLLTPEQWAEVKRELDQDDGASIPHDEVVAEMRARFGK